MNCVRRYQSTDGVNNQKKFSGKPFQLLAGEE